VLTLFTAAGMMLPGLIIAQDFAGGVSSEEDSYQNESFVSLNNMSEMPLETAAKLLAQRANLSLNKPIEPHTNIQSGVPENVIDGDFETAWYSYQGNNSVISFTVDLQSIEDIHAYRIQPLQSRSFEIETSVDSIEWTSRYTEMDWESWPDHRIREIIVDEPYEARYMRYTGKNTTQNAYVGVMEFEVFGGEALFCGGEGTEAEPYLICNADQLNNIREDLTAHYKLANDIDLDVVPYNEDEGWEPIGTEENSFKGVLDGDDHSINNLFINRPESSYVGLFSYVDEAEISNLSLLSVDITGKTHVAALAANMYMDQEGEIGILENIRLTGSVSGTGGPVGGVIARSRQVNLTNIASEVDVTGGLSGGSDFGGIVGNAQHDTFITGTYSMGDIYSENSRAGGITGTLFSSRIENSFSTSNVTGRSDTGGLVGSAGGSSLSPSTISKSYATGNVIAFQDDFMRSFFGGLVGNSGITNIEDCYATGSVTGERGTGGLVGSFGDSENTLTNSYAAGAVSGTENEGGLVGDLRSGTITNSFYDTQTSGQSDTGKGTAKTTVDMKQQSTFTAVSWDFTNLWAIESGDYISYPYFGNSEEAPEQDPPPGLVQISGFAENPRLTAAAGTKTEVTTAHILFGESDEVIITRIPFRGKLLLDDTEIENGDSVLKTEVVAGDLEFLHEGDRTDSEYNYTDFRYATTIEERTLPVDLAARGIEYGHPEGWFLFSSPEEEQTVGNLLRNMRTEGYPGSTNPGASFPTVYTLNQKDYEWAAVTGFDQRLVPGTALLVYVFDEDAPKNPLLHSNGPWAPLDGTFTYDELLGYDPDQGSGGNSFYLIGNPHPVPINICRMLIEGDNIASSYYVWRPEENDGNGGYVSYTCEVPAKRQSVLDSDVRVRIDVLQPFTGFWVRTTAVNPELAITENDYLQSSRKATGELPEPLTFELVHNNQNYSSRVHILLRDDAEMGLDRIDVIKMSSSGLAENYLEFYAMDEESRNFALRSLPDHFEEPVTIPLAVETTVSGNYTFRWTPPSEEYGMGYTLKDMGTGAEYKLGSEGDLSLSMTETGDEPEVRFQLVISSVGFEAEPELPSEIALKQNYPNPFNPTTVIEYQLPQSAQVRLQVFDMAGRQVAELVNEQVSAGTHTLSFDAANLSSGVYMYRLQAGSTLLTRKLTVVK